MSSQLQTAITFIKSGDTRQGRQLLVELLQAGGNRVDLVDANDQLGKRIHQSSADRDRAPNRNIIVRKFITCDF